MTELFIMNNLEMKKHIVEQRFPNNPVLLIEEEKDKLEDILEKLVLLGIIDKEVKSVLLSEEIDPMFGDIIAIILEEAGKAIKFCLNSSTYLWLPHDNKWV
jgi:hypothetical protein